MSGAFDPSRHAALLALGERLRELAGDAAYGAGRDYLRQGMVKDGTVAGAIARYWHKNEFGFIASRLYIAWCAAAISFPVIAGALFDRSGNYAIAVWAAAGINIVGVLVARGLPPR